MDRVLSWSLWLAGIAAILGALGVANLTFTVLFIRIDVLMLLVGLICLGNAYYRTRPAG